MENRSLYHPMTTYTLIKKLSKDTTRSIFFVCLATSVVGMSLGSLAASYGLALWIPLCLSVFVLAGTAEFIFIGFLAVALAHRCWSIRCQSGSLAVTGSRRGLGQALFLQAPVQGPVADPQVLGQFTAGAFECGQGLRQCAAVERRRSRRRRRSLRWRRHGGLG